MIIGVYHATNPWRVMSRRRIRALVKEAGKQGVSLLFFRSTDIDAARSVIRGEIVSEAGRVACEAPYPSAVINPNPLPVRLRNEAELHLRSQVPFTTHLFGSKWKVGRRLSEQPHLAPLVVPTSFVQGAGHLEEWLDRYGKLIVKPNSSSFGQGVRALWREESGYAVQYGTEVKRGDRDAFAEWAEAWSNEYKIVQPYIHCVTPEGEPFDFRVLAQRSGDGLWHITNMYPKIGKAGAIASNIAAGGRTEPLVPFLKRLFPEGFERIAEMLRMSGIEIAKAINQGQPFRQCEFGIDLAVDDRRRIWFYEANICPRTRFIEEERARNVLVYARYAAAPAVARAPGRRETSIALLVSEFPPAPILSGYAVEALRTGTTLYAANPALSPPGSRTIQGFRFRPSGWAEDTFSLPDPAAWIDRRAWPERRKHHGDGSADAGAAVPTLRLSAWFRSVSLASGQLVRAPDYAVSALNIAAIHRMLRHSDTVMLTPDSIVADPGEKLLIRRRGGGHYTVISGSQLHMMSETECSVLLNWLSNRAFIALPSYCMKDSQGVPFFLQAAAVRTATGEWCVAAVEPVYSFRSPGGNAAEQLWLPRDVNALLKGVVQDTAGASPESWLCRQIRSLAQMTLPSSGAMDECTIEIGIDPAGALRLLGLAPMIAESLLKFDEVIRLQMARALHAQHQRSAKAASHG